MVVRSFPFFLVSTFAPCFTFQVLDSCGLFPFNHYRVLPIPILMLMFGSIIAQNGIGASTVAKMGF